MELSRRMGLRIFRLGSNFIPFASHPFFRQEWFNKIGKILREVASSIKSYGIRITTHPGQYVVLNSHRESVVKRSLAELKYHFWLLDALNLGEDSVVVIHVGGVYGDKSRAVKRLGETLENNRWLIRRLALENDERHYTASEVIEIVILLLEGVQAADIIIEAKKKEKAIAKLLEELRRGGEIMSAHNFGEDGK